MGYKVKCSIITDESTYDKTIYVNFDADKTVNEFNRIINKNLGSDERGIIEGMNFSYGSSGFFMKFNGPNENRLSLNKWFEGKKQKRIT